MIKREVLARDTFVLGDHVRLSSLGLTKPALLKGKKGIVCGFSVTNPYVVMVAREGLERQLFSCEYWSLDPDFPRGDGKLVPLEKKEEIPLETEPSLPVPRFSTSSRSSENRDSKNQDSGSRSLGEAPWVWRGKTRS